MSGQAQYLLVGGIMILAGSVSGCNTEPDSDSGEPLFEEGESDAPIQPSSSSSACSTYTAPSTLGECGGCSICLDRPPAVYTCYSWTAANGKRHWNLRASYVNGDEQTTGCK